MLAEAGFTPQADSELWKTPGGLVIPYRLAVETVEGLLIEKLNAEFPRAWRRREDRSFFAGLAMRALIGKLPAAREVPFPLPEDWVPWEVRVRAVVAAEAVAIADAMLKKLEE